MDKLLYIDKILQLKTIWDKIMDNGPADLTSMIEPYEDLLCETFEGCWLQNFWHMPRNYPGEKYELLSGTYNGKKYYYTLCHSTDENGREKTNKTSWDNFFWELVLNRRLKGVGSTCRYLESMNLKKILEQVS